MLFGVTDARAQDAPVDIPKKELPKKAHCTVCISNGTPMGEEKPAAGVRYKGKEYFFCNMKEVPLFKEDPEGYLPPVLPRPAPSFALPELSGGNRALADYKGKVVLVDFWATWCAPCVASMPDMQKLHDRYSDRGFTVVGVSIDEDGEKKVRPFIAKRKFTYPILLDSDKEKAAWKAYKVHAVPAVFLIDKSGQVVKQWNGKIDRKEVEAAVAELLK